MPSTDSPKIELCNEEMFTIRDAMRELNRMVGSLERGELKKVVLMQHNQIKAVVLTPHDYAELVAAARSGGSV